MAGASEDRDARVERNRAALMDAAEDIYAEFGTSALTTRGIAERADTTTQAVYTYFGSRDELVAAMFDRAVESINSLMSFAISGGGENPSDDEVVARFVGLAQAYRAFCLEYPGRFRIIRTAGSDGAAPPHAVEIRDQLVGTLIEFGRSGGSWQFDGYGARVHLTLSAVHGFILAELEGFITDEHEPDELFLQLIHRCLVRYEDIVPMPFDADS